MFLLNIVDICLALSKAKKHKALGDAALQSKRCAMIMPSTSSTKYLINVFDNSLVPEA